MAQLFANIDNSNNAYCFTNGAFHVFEFWP